MKDKLTRILSIAIAVMGVVHIVATFTPLIGIDQLPETKQNAMTYMSLMCGAMLIVCGLLISMLHGKLKAHSFLRMPYMIILVALLTDGIAAVAFMFHNPFAWALFILILCVVINHFIKNRK